MRRAFRWRHAQIVTVAALVGMSAIACNDSADMPLAGAGEAPTATAAPDGTEATTPGAPPTPDPVDPVAADGTELDAWTLMFYAVGDNNTDGAMAQEIRNMLEAGLGGDVNMYVLFDRSPEDYSAYFDGWPEDFPDGELGNIADFSTAKVMRVEGDQLVEELDLGEIDSSHPDTLAWFIAEVMRQAPAQRTALFLADHGLGAYAFGEDEDTGRGDSTFTAQTIAQGIASGLAPSGRRLDLIGFTACLMANYETARWLAPHADYLLAAEDLMPFTGLQYDRLAALVADPSMTAEDLGRELVRAYGDFHQGSEVFSNKSLSLTDLTRIGLLEGAVGSFARSLVSAGDIVGFQRAVQETLDAAPINLQAGLLDLGDLARRLAQPGHPDEVRITADAVFAAVSELVLESWAGGERSTVTGMSISVPADSYVLDRYSVVGDPTWAEWVGLVVESQTGSGSASTASAWTTPVPTLERFDDQGLVVSGDLADPAEVIGTRGLFGTVADDGQMIVSIVTPAIENSGVAGRVAASWDFSLLEISAGDTVIYPTAIVSTTDASGNLEVAGVYSSAGVNQPAVIVTALDPETGAAGTPVLYVQGEGGAWAQAAPQPGSTFTGNAVVIGQSGASIGEIPIPALPLDAPLSASIIKFPPGSTIAAGLAAISSDQSISAIWGGAERS